MLLHRPLRRVALFAIACLAGTNLTSVATAQPHTPGTAQLAGWAYIDRNNDGELAFSNEPNPEFVIPNLTISLYSQDGPETFLQSVVTDDGGRFFFNNLAPGTYGLKQTQPVEYVDGLDTVGILQRLTNVPLPPNADAGTAANNAFNNIVLTADIRADFYLFGERGLAPGFVSKRYLLGSAPELPVVPIPEPTTLLGPLTAAAIALLRRCRRTS
jgi:hypothetical protein